MKKLPSFVYDILLVVVGICLGAILMYNHDHPPAYPGPGDWNGDGVLSIEDLYTAVDDLINGTDYPEYVIG